MGSIRFGFQAYTWQMSLDGYRGRVGHILDVVARAGGAGFEPEVCMLGDYAASPSPLAEELHARGLQLGGLCYAEDWRHGRETEEEAARAANALDYLECFSGTMLVLSQRSGEDRRELRERQRNAVSCMNAIARRAEGRGIRTACHPSSAPGSVFRIREDYEFLIEHLDARVLGLAPDSGHLTRGGIGPLEFIRTYRPLVRHLHLKDVSPWGEWVEMGRGVIDFPAIVGYLAETGYNGWIMVEDESRRAQHDPDTVTIENGQYVQHHLAGCTREGTP